MSPCPVCGGNRLPIEQTSRYTVWICPTCDLHMPINIARAARAAARIARAERQALP